jgi:hypothetical protein
VAAQRRGLVTFAKDFLKVAVQKLNDSIIHSSIVDLTFNRLSGREAHESQ